MDIKVGDYVKVISNKYMHYSVKIGDKFKVIEVTDYGKAIMKNDRITQTSFLPDNEIVKIKPKLKYVEPEYIKETKKRIKYLNATHWNDKYRFRNRDKAPTKLTKKICVNTYQSNLKELNYLYDILKQHSQLKKLYARVND